MPTLVWFSEIKWKAMRSRKQFMLSRFGPEWRILFLEPINFSRGNAWNVARDGAVAYGTVPFVKLNTTSGIYNRLLGLAAFRAFLNWIATLQARRLLRQFGAGPDALFAVSNIFAHPVAVRLPHRGLCYDFNDHPFQFPGAPAWARSWMDPALGAADRIFVVSRHYVRELEGLGYGPLQFLGNGVEYDRFAGGTAVAPGLRDAGRPVIGYIGLVSFFISFEWVEALGRAFPDATVVFVGPVHARVREKVAALTGRAPFVFAGEQPYEELGDWIRGFDVGIIPFDPADPYTRAINPNKIHQFLACGCPVVSCPMSDELEGAPGLTVAETAEAFVEGVRAALARRPDPGPLREYARANDWGARAAEMQTGLLEAAAGHGGALGEGKG
ncbi:MAG: glycosyltransferase [Candidatus Eisenbacteria bacterium]|nr:glycosyltransferase [Candidatus Eisenbacteria bacterium]